jgi:hypothetical protein
MRSLNNFNIFQKLSSKHLDEVLEQSLLQIKKDRLGYIEGFEHYKARIAYADRMIANLERELNARNHISHQPSIEAREDGK